MNSKIKILVLRPFFDKYTGVKHPTDEILEITELDRAKDIQERKLGKIIQLEIGEQADFIVYTSRIFTIGGIETACYNIAKAFGKRVSFIFGEADLKQVERIAKYSSVRLDDGSDIDCDALLVMGYDGLNRIKAKQISARKIYHQIHADWNELKKLPLYSNYKLETKGIDRFLTVSETAQKGLEDTFNVQSVVVPNILIKEQYAEIPIFLALTRLEAEKGGNILLGLIQRFQNASKRFLFIICGGGSEQGKIFKQLCTIPNVILLPSAPENLGLLKKADYLVQTSLCESYCYSIHEALAEGVPVISTDIPEARKVIQDGKNGYLFGFNYENLDIDKIFNHIPKFKAKSEVVEPIWEDVIKGKL